MAKNGTPPGAGLISGSHFQNFWIFARPPGFFELKIVVQPASDRVGPGMKFWFGAVGVPWVVHFFSTPRMPLWQRRLHRKKIQTSQDKKFLKFAHGFFFCATSCQILTTPPLPHDFFEPKFHSWAHAIWCRPNEFQLKKSRGSSEKSGATLNFLRPATERVVPI